MTPDGRDSRLRLAFWGSAGTRQAAGESLHGVRGTTRFTVFWGFGARETGVWSVFAICACVGALVWARQAAGESLGTWFPRRLPVQCSVGVRATGRWGEPPGVVSDPLTRALARSCARDPPLGRASGRAFRGAHLAVCDNVAQDGANATGQQGAQRGQGGLKKHDFSLVAARSGFRMLVSLRF